MEPADLDAVVEHIRLDVLGLGTPSAEVPAGALEERLQVLHAVLERLRVDHLDAVAAFDTAEEWLATGATSCADWLARAAGTSRRDARRDQRLAQGLRAMPLVAAAVESGELSLGAARLLDGARRGRTAAAFAVAEAELVATARTLTVDNLAAYLRQWAAVVDPDGCEPTDGHDRNELHCSPTLDGRFRIDGNLDAEAGGIFATALSALTDELFRHEDDRSRASTPAARRRADALVEMARRAMAGDPDAARPPRPLLTLVTDLDALAQRAGRLVAVPTGGELHPETARRLACDASLVRVVMAGESEVIDVGRASRQPTAAQARAVLARDSGCGVDGCDAPPWQCEIHHLVHWADGGPTDLDNLAMLCRRHHRAVHEGRLRATRAEDGSIRLDRAPPTSELRRAG